MINFKSSKNQILLYLAIAYLYLSHPHLSFARVLDFNFNQEEENNLKNIQGISPQDFMSGVIILALNVSIITFVFIFLLGGYRWLTSSGDEKKLAAARNQITHGLIGLIVIFCSWLIMGIIGFLFDIDILKWTIPSFVSPSS